MSAFAVSGVHIDAMLTAGLSWAKYGPLSWMERDLEPEEEREAYVEGEPWGSLVAYRKLRRELTYETAGMVGAMLLAENRRSVNHRYAEDEWEEPYIFTKLAGKPDPVIVLKAIGCYEYQSCEHPGWQDSEARRFCEALRFLAISHLPGYEGAEGWEVRDRNVFLRAAKVA